VYLRFRKSQKEKRNFVCLLWHTIEICHSLFISVMFVHMNKQVESKETETTLECIECVVHLASYFLRRLRYLRQGLLAIGSQHQHVMQLKRTSGVILDKNLCKTFYERVQLAIYTYTYSRCTRI
jgi:hypothetical protein